MELVFWNFSGDWSLELGAFTIVAKPANIQLPDGPTIPILYEDRAVLAIDKPAGWLLAPGSWDRTGRHLQRALESSMRAGDFWARSRNLKFLRFVHRLDAETCGVLLMVKSPGALPAYSQLFEQRSTEKIYLAVVEGVPSKAEWTCNLPIGPDPAHRGRMKAAAPRRGQAVPVPFKSAETRFRVLKEHKGRALLEVRPVTGRTHQIRVHLLESGNSVVGDTLYGGHWEAKQSLALRAVLLAYRDPFTRKVVRIEADWHEFVSSYGFKLGRNELFSGFERQTF